uniref:WD_REPEATS_REGION domain-containing protein n=1 Tax=Heterorhabditis bacteriophora TaxID=37862 RepID=A0A1I7WD07_HETBA
MHLRGCTIERNLMQVNLLALRRDPLKESDDYQLFTEGPSQQGSTKPANMQLTPWIIDRSRKGLVKMFKRTVSGIRRIDSHPTAPFYVTGSSDGSIRVWEWGVGQPVYTARVAGQHAKVCLNLIRKLIYL